MTTSSLLRALTLGFTLVTLNGCGASGAVSTADAEPRVGVQVQTVVQGDLVQTLTSTAVLEARRNASVVAETSGQVLVVLVEEGDTVSKGQLLARLDGDRARLQVAQERALQRRLSHDNDRSIQLEARAMISGEAMERARFDLAAQTATLELAELEWAHREIRAPFAGVIIRRHIKPGQTLALHAAAFELADFSALEARLSVPEAALAALAPGQAAELIADAFPGIGFRAKVARVAAVVDGKSGTAPVVLDVEETGTPLRPGQLVRVRLQFARIAAAVLLPKAAVIAAGVEPYVFVIDQGIAHRRAVALGPEQGDRVQALSGVDPGNEVAVLGQNQLSDQDRVSVIRSPALATVDAVAAR